MPWNPSGCDPRLATLLKQWLALGSYVLMATERIAAVAIALGHNNLDSLADTAQEAHEARNIVHQIELQRQIAMSMAQLAVAQTEMLRELADDLQHELTAVIDEVTYLTRSM